MIDTTCLLLNPYDPSLFDVLLRFLFGTIIGWWILIVLGAVLATPILRRLRAWEERRRFIHSEGNKFANPQNADARYRLADIYFRGHRYGKAEGLLRDAIAIAEESPLYESVPHRFTVLMADILYGRRRYAEAEKWYQNSLNEKSDLGSGDVYLGLGRCALRTGKPEDALGWLQSSLKERTSYLETYFRKAQAAARLGKEDVVRQARQEFSQTMQNLPRFARQGKLWWRLAFLLFPLSRHLL